MPSFSHILSNPIPKTPKRIVLKSPENLSTNIDKNRVYIVLCQAGLSSAVATRNDDEVWVYFELSLVLSLSVVLSLSSDVKSGGLSLPELSCKFCVAMSVYYKQHLAWIFTLCVVIWEYSHYVYVDIYS